jgi:hypothetical protein
MRAPRKGRAALLVALASVAPDAAAHVRLVNPSNGNALRWPSSSNVSIVTSSAGSADVPGESDTAALRIAIASWSSVPGSTARLVEDQNPGNRARTDWPSDDVHLMLFDESNASGFFPSGTGIVALTPVAFQSSGTIVDADVLFNGAEFQFTTSGAPARFDVQDVATHELGHLLGLDHTGWAGATMYPYVDPTVILQRSLARDDVNGLRDAYPAAAFGSISGRILRASNASPVAGANVVARDASGRTAGGTISASDGTFTLRGLDPGNYAVLATPLDFPVSAGDLSGGQSVATDFGAALLTAGVVVGTGGVGVGDLSVPADDPVSLGRNFDELPLPATSGDVQVFSLSGAGLFSGATLAASDPDIAVTPLAWLGTVVTFSLSVPAGEAAGHADLTVTASSGGASLLPAAIEIAPPAPVLGLVTPATGSISGGTPIVIAGSNFRAGARVILAGELYLDGAPGGATVVDDGTILLTTRAGALGAAELVVQDPSGVEARSSALFAYEAQPTVDAVFPASGADTGGTLVHVQGRDYVSGTSVRIAGVLQTGVQILSQGTLRFTTTGGTAGGPYVLEVLAPGGDAGTGTFSYSAAPDPRIDAISPAQGSTSGGTRVTISGSGFAPGVEVVFGADPVSGGGGAQAYDVVVIDASTLQATTPARPAGVSDVLVRAAGGAQATTTAAAFTFTTPSGGGGGGGCTLGRAPGGGPMDGVQNLLPLLAAAALVLLSGRRGRLATARG